MPALPAWSALRPAQGIGKGFLQAMILTRDVLVPVETQATLTALVPAEHVDSYFTLANIQNP